MNIYRVTESDTGEFVFEGNTEKVLEQFFLTRDLLSSICRSNKSYAGFNFVKVGEDGIKRGRKKKEIKTGTEFNTGLDADLAKANELGLTYGEYKNKYFWGA